MATIKQIIDTIEQFAPLHLQETWDNCGLQVGYQIDRKLTSALLTLDVTEKTVVEAKQKGANLIISHHPLIFNGLRTITESDVTQRIVIEAIRADIVIYSSHTAMDSCAGGINDCLAQMLGLSDVSVLSPLAVDPTVGLGRIGRLPKSMNASEFAESLKAQFKLPVIRYNDSGRQIERIALCGGSGSSLIDCAVQSGVDAYVCGDLKYHNYGDGDAKSLSMFDIGHFESEICVLDIFSSIISKKFPNFVASKSANNFIKYGN